MRLLIAGSRDWQVSPEAIDKQFCFVLCREDVTEVVSGGARGADDSGEAWAAINGIPIKRFPAKWDTYGKIAGIMRNIEMADYADMAMVFWRKQSTGSANMIANMVARGKFVRVVRPKDVGRS